MAVVTINGQEVSVADGSTVIQAAEKAGVYVPRYCYHPGLPLAGSCRMCLVEIEKMPKLAISCYTRIQDGMVVSTDSDKARQARRAMLEFLLTDHPLDCPVCDQSGECDLQNYYMEIGRYDSRFLEDKIKRRKAFAIGPHVMLDQERCILCTRCTRFTEAVTGTHELGVFNRGSRSVIDVYPGRSLENNYSGNVIDICPVGALTEREFRFQCRVWYLSTCDSICNGCARGCNISIHYNDERRYKAGGRRVQRLKPRFNPEVNQWWMCDLGRFGYRFVDSGRIEWPQRRSGGGLEACTWEEALAEAGQALTAAVEKFGPGSVAVMASPGMSNEELYLTRKLFRELLGIDQIGFRNPAEEPGFEDDFLIRADRNPNSRGGELMGLDGDVSSLLEKTARGEIKVLWVMAHDLEGTVLESLDRAQCLVFQGSNWNATAQRAHLVLPQATCMESDGTFTNFEGRVQRFERALPPLGESRAGIDILTALAESLGSPLVYLRAEDVFLEWQGKGYGELGVHGMILEG